MCVADMKIQRGFEKLGLMLDFPNFVKFAIVRRKIACAGPARCYSIKSKQVFMKAAISMLSFPNQAS